MNPTALRGLEVLLIVLKFLQGVFQVLPGSRELGMNSGRLMEL